MSVKVYCSTSIDTLKRAKWPERLASVPEIGSYIRATEPVWVDTKQRDTGEIVKRKIEWLDLRVAHVIHINGDDDEEPYVQIQLHHPHAVEMGWLY